MNKILKKSNSFNYGDAMPYTISQKQYIPKFKLVVFDLDRTLFYETIFEQVFCILSNLRRLNLCMSIASFNPCAEWLCDRYDIKKYFDHICEGREKYGDSKIDHIQHIRTEYKKQGIEFDDHDIIFFDDDEDNIRQVEKYTNIKCIQVDGNIGITNGHLLHFF